MNVRQGWLSYLSGDYAKSVQYYQAARHIAPKSTEAMLGNLLPLLAQERYKPAEALAEQILRGDHGNYYANLRLAVALRKQEDFTAAERIVQKMRIAYPADVAWMTELGLLDLAQDKKDAAKEVFADVLSLDPENVAAGKGLQKP